MRNVFDVYSDPGHGWIKVQWKDLVELGISKEITGYSYIRGDWAYLEEDQDAGTFIKAYVAKTGKKPVFRSHSADYRSRIRNYPHFPNQVTA